ncbi:MAG: SEC-C metal-binding domain-containing protein [Fimbriimonadales bacterium]
MSKRRHGYPSETSVKRGRQTVGDGKELEEKLGRNDPCPCGSGRHFQSLLPQLRPIRWRGAPVLLLEIELRLSSEDTIPLWSAELAPALSQPLVTSEHWQRGFPTNQSGSGLPHS